MTAINTVALMVTYPIYLHFLGFEKYGLWLVLATVLGLSRLGNLGFDQAIMKLVAEAYGCSDTKGIAKYATTSMALLCLSGTIVLIIILIFKNQIIYVFNLEDKDTRTVLLLLPYVGILSVYIFLVEALNATLAGLRRIDLANYNRSIGRILSLVVSTILLYCDRGIESLLIGNALDYMFIHIASLICIRREINIRFLRTKNFDLESCRRILSFVGGIFGSTVITMIREPFNKLMLSRYAGISTLPVYEIVIRSAFQIKSLVDQGLRALLPEISRLSGLSTDYAIQRIQTITIKAIKMIIFWASPIYITLFITAEFLFKLWLRDKYVDTIPLAFRLMLVGSYASMAAGPAFYAIMGMGKVRHYFISNTIITLGNLIGVSTFFFLTGKVSVNAICSVLIPCYLLSALYIILKARSEWKRLQEKHLLDS